MSFTYTGFYEESSQLKKNNRKPVYYFAALANSTIVARLMAGLTTNLFRILLFIHTYVPFNISFDSNETFQLIQHQNGMRQHKVREFQR